MNTDRKMKIFVLGPAGTHSHEAANRLWPRMGGAEIVFQGSPREAILAMLASDGPDDVAVVPVDNSTEGLVGEVIGYWRGLRRAPEPGRPFVVGELLLAVRHCLARKRVGLGSALKVVSHPQALGQCRAYLDAAGIEQREAVASTARAAALVDDPRTPDYVAALCSLFAAERHGLFVEATCVQDDPHNATRFHVVGKRPASATGHDRAAAIFSLDDYPGVLRRALACFEDSQVNVSAIDSLRTGAPGVVDFYIEVDCHDRDRGGEHVFRELRKVAKDVFVLGGYPQGRLPA